MRPIAVFGFELLQTLLIWLVFCIYRLSLGINPPHGHKPWKCCFCDSSITRFVIIESTHYQQSAGNTEHRQMRLLTPP